MISGGTYFTGGGGVEIAFRACGIEGYFGVEYDDVIAQVARDNGFNVTTSDVREINPATLPRADWFHASPVCKNASNAKSNGKESPEDMETAQAVERYIDCHKPRIFSLENVWGYHTFKAFQDILKCLNRNGYKFEYWHLNSANYGVPQTRKRLILVARNDGKNINRPNPTHAKNPAPMFDDRKKWIGWYESIEDLIPTLPPSKFAKWQLDRLPKEITETFLFSKMELNTLLRDMCGRAIEEPSATVTALDMLCASYVPRALIVPGQKTDAREQSEPMQTVTENHGANKYRAWLEQGRVVKMTSRALARFQSFPDDYKLPEKPALACKIIGNAVPPLLMQRVIEANL